MSSRPVRLARLNTGAAGRNLAMAKLGIGAGIRGATHSATNLFRSAEQRQQADRAFLLAETERFVAELGQLKGSVMKIGQMLSLYGQYFLPPEAVAILRGLQDDSAHVDWTALQPAVHHSLGPEKFSDLDIDPEPLAAASLGQVHRCRLRGDDSPLCLKVRYPGVTEAIDSDLRSVARLLLLGRLLPEQISLRPMLAEIRDMLEREVDYPREARMTRQIRSDLQADSRFVVPRIETAYCSENVLLMSFEHGLSLNDPQVLALSQARRDALGRAFFDLFCQEFFAWHRVQTDPHFGNYRLRQEADTDRIVLLDFGATRHYQPGFVRAYAQILRGGLDRDIDLVMYGCAGAGIGIADENVPDPVKLDFYRMICLIVEPFCGDLDDVRAGMFTAAGAYRWDQGDVFVSAGRLMARSAARAGRHFRMPPREIVFLHRRLAGVYMLLAHLGCELDLREPLEHYLTAATSAPETS